MTDFARLVLDADTRGLKRGERDLQALSQSSRSAAGVVEKAMGRVGLAIGAAFSVSTIVRTNAEFGASMSRVAAISGATAQELDQLRQTALKMGADTAFSAAQAADAMGFLAMAGFDATEAMEAIPDVLALAAASGMDLARAADIASNVMSGFGKEAKDAGQIADVLAEAASNTNTNVEQLGQAMSTAAPIAAALGISMEETAAAIGVMSDAGIQGERAGTALRGIFASLAQPTDQAAEALAKYGLAVEDVDPQAVGLANAMKAVADAGVSTGDAFIIFGREAASGALVMAKTADRMKELTSQFQNAEGAAQEMAEVMRDNLTGDIDELTGSLETMIITLGDSGVTGALRSMAQFGTMAINLVTENMRLLGSVVATAGSAWAAYRLTLLASQAAGVLMTSTLVSQTGAIAAYTANVGLLTAAKTGATVAARTLMGVLIANPFTAVAVAVGALTAAFVGMGQAQAQARAETDNLVRSLRSLAQARSADYALRRAEVDVERRRLETQLAGIRAEQQRIRQSPELAQRPTTNARFKALEEEARGLTWRIIEMEGELGAADKAFKQAEKAAESMVTPVAQGAAAVSGLSRELNGASVAAKAANDDFADLMETLYPENITRRQMQQLDMIEQYASRIANPFEARLRALGVAGEAAVSSATITQGPLEEARKVMAANDNIGKSLEELQGKAKRNTVTIADTFAQMSQRITSSLSGLANSIRSGDFLGILGGVLNVFTQLGSAGVFGKGLANTLNKSSLPSADGGGFTGMGPRSGGLDGKGGFLAMLHPRETVIDHTRGQTGAPMNITVTPSPYFDVRVDGRIIQAAPAVANAGAMQAQAMGARSARRRVR